MHAAIRSLMAYMCLFAVPVQKIDTEIDNGHAFLPPKGQFTLAADVSQFMPAMFNIPSMPGNSIVQYP
jgi:hypothetical protein